MKKLNMILPALAILFAVSAALVSFATPKADGSEIIVSLSQSECDIDGQCVASGSVTCVADARFELGKTEAQLPAIYETDNECVAYDQIGQFTDLQ